MSFDPDEPESMPRDCRPFDAINPYTRGTWKIYMRDSAMDRALKGWPGQVRELGITVKAAVMEPTAIFRGDPSEGEPEWICYASRPQDAYDYKTGERRRPWSGKVFLVKVDRHRIYQWSGWVKAAPDNIDLPEMAFDERLM